MTVVDIHTHMLNDEWLHRLKAHGGPHFTVREFKGQQVVHVDGAPFMTLLDGMFDYELRIENMTRAGVDVAIVSLTCPSVFWGGPEVSLDAARQMNDDMAARQAAWPDRLRWFASLPWQYPELAVEELNRAAGNGAVGVFVTANVRGMSLTNETLAPVWEAIESRGLPVLVHPTAPPGVAEMDAFEYNLVASVGFTFDTTLAVSRMIFDGFFDRYRELKIIAAHAGGYLPYLAGRLDVCYENMPACREKIDRAPSTYLPRIYYDTVVFSQPALELCLHVAGADNMLYGSDYPHNIGDMRGCLSRVDALPADARRKIRGENAARVFRL